MKIPENTNKISFQGEFGANSHIACSNMFPHMDAIPSATFEDALNLVEKGQADLAMIPIENTLAGRVADIHHLLPQSSLYIIDEYFLPIHFQLMVLPGVKHHEIKTVYSHIHALAQCRKIIRKNGWKPVTFADTAGAAKFIKKNAKRSQAALAPLVAAKLYGLDILEKNVEDNPRNITRFVILSRSQRHVPKPQNGEKIITSLLFRIRNVPAALYKAMGGFATNGINMTKLESYQIGGNFNATQFFVDIEGHPEDIMMQHALEELAFFSAEFRIIGIYPAQKDRASYI
ncbi:prephenate dehydratase [Bartonella raoultii]|uniref:prephenate dehydratase n=1 Tax=Bartonella raoultii TaxID=1457020 RepID=A0ABS7I563_9HYPH|nr:prephenate dehydratase [Bartonella raoultii]MBX4335485.1 prephenate dehydratase [Bartonella raoultii]